MQAFGGVAPTVKALVVDGSTLCDEDEVQDVLSDGATVEAVLADDEARAASPKDGKPAQVRACALCDICSVYARSVSPAHA